MIKPTTHTILNKNDELNSPEAIRAAANGIGCEELPMLEKDKGSRNLVIVLQGYFHTKESVIEWATYLRDTSGLSARYKCCWYDYFWKPFYDSGIDLYNKIKAAHPNPDTEFDNIIVVGFSMGGLVARTILCLGFPFTKLITLCSPHEGTFDYVADWGGVGAKSMRKDSPYIKFINANDTDSINRYKHLYIAHDYMTDKDHLKYYDDTIVVSESAIGSGLGHDHDWIKKTWHYDQSGPLLSTETYTPHKLPGIKEYYPSTAKQIIDYLKSIK